MIQMKKHNIMMMKGKMIILVDFLPNKIKVKINLLDTEG